MLCRHLKKLVKLMVWHTGKFRKKSIIFTAALLILCSASYVLSQDVFSGGFIGRGVSKIVDGDIASARHSALVDAQKKAVMEAVCAQLSVEDMAKYFLTLKNVFIGHPGIYLQRFKIINENSLFDSYQVTIQGFVQQELLRHDLESLGIVGPEREKIKVLLMIAEKGIDQPDETFWWSSNKDSVPFQYAVQQKLEKYFIEKGSCVVNPFDAPVNISSEEIGQSSEPDVEAVCKLASQFNAQIVVLGKSEIKRAEGQKLSSLESIQCDLSARVIDARNRYVIVQAATYALGIHIDEESAAVDAIEKACRHIAEQIIDKIYMQMKNMHEYLFKLTFDKPVSETEVREWFNAFKESFPENELIEIGSTREKNSWTAKLNSPIQGADILQKMFETGIKGYKTEVVSVDEKVIALKVSVVKQSSQDPGNF